MAQDNGCIGCGGGGEKKVSRAEFLASGAAAAVAASVGGPGAAAASFAGSPPKRQGCVQNCPPSSAVWRVDASVLNALWSDCMPRLVAKHWLDGLDSIGQPTFGNTPGDPSMVTFLDKLADDIDALPVSSPKFAERQKLVVNYLRTSTNTRIPIRIVQGAGFDYVLSDWGLDIFTPPEPASETDLYLYYTYRNTGNPAIGIPFYMADAVAGGDIDAPTGPSQSLIDPNVIINIISAAAASDAISGDCAQMAIRCLRESAGVPDPNDLRIGGSVAYDPHGTAARGERPEPARRRNPAPAVSTEIVKCVLEPLRCWQITGSVFRGIQVQLPRIVATKWLEQSSPPVAPQCYALRIHQPGGLREVLMERLETTLPGSNRMQLEMRPSPIIGGPMPAEIRVTNRGLLFPYAPDLNQLPDPTQPPSVNRRRAILEGIMAGSAGNPVFTDSMRCD